MKLILFNKYLIRTDDYNFLLDKVKQNSPPIIKRAKKKDGNEYDDFSNFKTVGYFTTFKECVLAIRRDIVMNNTDHIDDITELARFLVELDKRIKKSLDKLLI